MSQETHDARSSFRTRCGISGPALGALLLVGALVIYFPALQGGILWDDPAHLTAPSLQSWAGLGKIWFQLGTTQQYYPILSTAFWLEHRLWGDHLLGYHLVNVILHAGSAWLLASVLRQLRPGSTENVELDDARFSFAEVLASALFLVHPVCVETVAWISEQKNTLSTVFYLTSALLFFRFDRSRSWVWYMMALGFFVLALASKSVTATLPAALLVLQWYRFGKIRWRDDVLPLAPWFVVGAAAGLFTAWVEKHYIGAQGAAFGLSLVARSFLAGRVIWFYLGKLFWPAKLIFIYPHWDVRVTVGWSLGLLGSVAVTATLWVFRKKSRAPLAAWLLFVGTLFPVLGFFDVYPFIFSYVADHWQYLACMAPLALVAGALARVVESRVTSGSQAGLANASHSRWWPSCVLAAVVVLGLGARAFRQSGNYQDAERLYRETISENSQCWMAHNNLGLALLDRGATDDAIEHFRAAIKLRPDYSDAHNNLGNALVRPPKLQMAAAVEEYAIASRLEPRDGEIHFNLGNALASLDRLPEALRELEWAVALLPQRADLHAGLGLALAQASRPDDAIREFREALRLDPDLAVAHFNLARLLREPSQRDEAFAHYRTALRLTPKLAPLWNSYATALLREGQIDEAIKAFRRAVELEPKNARFHSNLGLGLRANDQLAPAIGEFRTALELDSSYRDAHYYLGLTLQQSGRIQEAETELKLSGRD